MSLKVTLFGGTGQGKTCYTLALLYLMVDGVEGFRIEDEDVDTTTKYMKPWSDFVLERRWPAPTMGRREDLFKLYFQDQFITEFRWVDYQGGAINQPTDESDAAAQLHADIKESNAVIIVADAYTIATRPLIEARMLTSAPLIFHLLNSYKFKSTAGEGLLHGITITIVLTKSDAVPDEYKENNYEKLYAKARQVFQGIYDFVDEERAKVSSIRPWLYPSAMLAVSIVGEGNAALASEGQGYQLASFNLAGSPEPQNIQYPFLYAIGNELDRTALVLEEQASDLERRLLKLDKNVLARILRGRTIKQLHEEQQELARRLQELEPKIRTVTKTANKRMRALVP